MTINPLDPPRLEEGGSDALRELMRVRRRGPSATALGKISERLAAAGVMQAPPASEARLAATRAASSYKLGAVALLLTGGLLVAWETVHTPAPPPSALTVAPAKAGETAPAAVLDSPPAAPAKTDAISVDELPSAAPAAEPASNSASPKADSRRNATSPGAASPDAPPPVAGRVATPSANELALVQRAEAVLGSDPQSALAIANEHARAFPSGEFLQEREVIAIDALVRLGRKDESLRRARALLQRFPQTPYAARIELAVGQLPASQSMVAAPQ